MASSFGMFGVATWRRNSDTSCERANIVLRRRIAAFNTTGGSFFFDRVYEGDCTIILTGQTD